MTIFHSVTKYLYQKYTIIFANSKNSCTFASKLHKYEHE